MNKLSAHDAATDRVVCLPFVAKKNVNSRNQLKIRAFRKPPTALSMAHNVSLWIYVFLSNYMV